MWSGVSLQTLGWDSHAVTDIAHLYLKFTTTSQGYFKHMIDDAVSPFCKSSFCRSRFYILRFNTSTSIHIIYHEIKGQQCQSSEFPFHAEEVRQVLTSDLELQDDGEQAKTNQQEEPHIQKLPSNNSENASDRSDKDSDDDSEIADDDSDGDSDQPNVADDALMKLKKSKHHSSGDEAEQISLKRRLTDEIPESTAASKIKKKKMKIRVGDVTGRRVVFDEEGQAQNPLQALAADNDEYARPLPLLYHYYRYCYNYHVIIVILVIVTIIIVTARNNCIIIIIGGNVSYWIHTHLRLHASAMWL